MADTTAPNATMRKITIKIPGFGSQEVFVGPGGFHVIDIDRAIRVECQCYLEAELIASVQESRKPIPIPNVRFSQSITGDAYDAFKAAHAADVDAIVGVQWEIMTEGRDNLIGDPPAPGQPDNRVNIFAGAVETFGPGHDLNPLLES